ncbi:alpha/beta-hydrolase family protein [Gordonia aichiensis]
MTASRGSRNPATPAPPQPAIAAAVILAAVIGLWPSPLPRTPWLAGLVMALCTGVTVGCTMLGLRLRRWPRHTTHWWPTGVVAAVLILASIVNMAWQNTIRSELGYGSVGPEWVVFLVGPTLAVVTAMVWLPRASAVAIAAAISLAAGLLAPSTGTASASTLSARVTTDADAKALVRQWVERGGPDDDAVLIAVPTGSGWIDPGALAAIGDRVGRMHTIAPRYASTQSWRAFVTDRGAAGRASVAVLSALTAELDAVPPQRRPLVILYGQSLGALGAETARVWADEHRPGALWTTVLSGVPADTIDTHAHGSPRRVIANATDPVTAWSPAVVWRPPTRPSDTVTVGRPTRHVPWIPLATFVQTSADLLGSLDGPAGVGHRYRGTDQVPR